MRRSPSIEPQALRAGRRQRTALILVAHGERDVLDPNRPLIAHAADLASRLSCLCVDCGVLNGEPSLETALDRAAKRGAHQMLIYPFFMSDGYFVSTVLPVRIAGAGSDLAYSVLPPLGFDDGLANLMMSRALQTATEAGFDPAASQLLVVGHGSKLERASAEATNRIADQLAAMARFQSVGSAFIEEPPFVGTELAGMRVPVVVLGFFAGDGMHSSRDVPESIEESRACAAYTGPIGTVAAIRDLVVATVARHGVAGD